MGLLKWFRKVLGGGSQAERPAKGAKARVSVQATKQQPEVPKPDPTHHCVFCREEFDDLVVRPKDAEFVDLATAKIKDKFPWLSPEELPPFPAAAAQLLAAVENPRADVNELVKMINREPVSATEVLRMANSAFYRGTSEIASVRDAVVRLGLKQVASVATASSARAMFSLQKRASPELFAVARGLWVDSLSTGWGSGWIAMRQNAAIDQAYLGGVLSGVGRAAGLHALTVLLLKSELPVQKVMDDLPFILEAVSPALGAQMALRCKFPKTLDGLFEPPEPLGSAAREIWMIWLVREVGGVLDGRAQPGLPAAREHLNLTCQEVRELSTYLAKEARVQVGASNRI